MKMLDKVVGDMVEWRRKRGRGVDSRGRSFEKNCLAGCGESFPLFYSGRRSRVFGSASSGSRLNMGAWCKGSIGISKILDGSSSLSASANVAW